MPEPNTKPKKDAWTMPEWMEPYRGLIGDTGGNSVERLYNGKTSVQINGYLAIMECCVAAQVDMLRRLHAQGLLTPLPGSAADPMAEMAAAGGTDAS